METSRIQMDRARNKEELRKSIEELEKENRDLSLKIAAFIECKRQLAQLKTEKVQLEQELSILKQGPFIKKLNKLEPHSSSIPSTASLLSLMEIQQKETLLSNAEMKVSLLIKKQFNMRARMDRMRRKLGQNVHKMMEMRAVLDSL